MAKERLCFFGSVYRGGVKREEADLAQKQTRYKDYLDLFDGFDEKNFPKTMCRRARRPSSASPVERKYPVKAAATCASDG
jgi:hypothetical protein